MHPRTILIFLREKSGAGTGATEDQAVTVTLWPSKLTV